MNALFIASDHRGFKLKEALKGSFSSSLRLIDLGCFSEESVDYPLITKDLCTKIGLDPLNKGILICGSGVGVCMAANRFNFVRAFVAHNSNSVKLARQHNNANVICLPSDFTTLETSVKYINMFNETDFLAERHARRTLQMQNLGK